MKRTWPERSEQDHQAERYRLMSERYLEDALVEVRCALWRPAEELLWGSLTAAVKAVAWSRGGSRLEGSAQVEEYAASLARETRDRRIRDAFTRLSGFSTLFDRVHDSRENARRILLEVDEIGSAVERMWRLIPSSSEEGQG